MSTQTTTEAGNFLRLGYDFFEEVMPNVSGNAFKVALVIYRETVGWHREQVSISYTDLEAKTGMCRRTLAKALKELLAKGIIRVCDAIGRWGMNIYALAQRFNPFAEKSTRAESILVQRQLPGTGAETILLVGQKLPYYQGRNDTSTMVETALEPSPEATPVLAPGEAKETLKKEKENTKESVCSAPADIRKNVQQEEEEDGERAPEWNTVQEVLREKVSSGQYFGWLQNIQARKRGDQFILTCRTSFDVETVKRRFGALIMSELTKLLPPSYEVFITSLEAVRSSA